MHPEALSAWQQYRKTLKCDGGDPWLDEADLNATGEYMDDAMKRAFLAGFSAALSGEQSACLIAALERVLLDIEFMWEDGTLPDRRSDIIYVAARAAISKAEGK